MCHALAEKRFDSYEDVKKLLDDWFAAKWKTFTDVVFTNFPKDGKMYNKRSSILWINHFSSFSRVFSEKNSHFILVRFV